MPKRSASPDGILEPPLKQRKTEWPAPRSQLDNAREFIRSCLNPPKHTLLVPDKDADGLSSGLLLYRTLEHLGLPKSHLHVHVLQKGTNVHSGVEREAMERYADGQVDRFIILDQGSRPGASLVAPRDGRRTLVIDHHWADKWPEQAEVLTACNSPPISTTSLLTYVLCKDLHEAVERDLQWIALLGVYGDLGQTVKFGKDGWGCSELADAEKRYTKKKISDAVAALNAPRRSARFNVRDAWTVLEEAKDLQSISSAAVLRLAKQETSAEIARCQAMAPKFSKDSRVALVRIESGCQVHPVIATRWAGTLKSAKKLEAVMCANTGYTPGFTHFSCRLNNRLRGLSDDERPNLIAMLKEYGTKAEELRPGWQAEVGEDFARGHKEATGGIIKTELFEVLCEAMEIGVKDDTPKAKKVKVIDKNQKGTLDSFFSSPTKVQSK